MPLTPRKTTPGIPLHSEFVGGESDTIREIPPEWRAALDITVEQIPMPWDRPILPLTDTVLASKAEQQYTSERTMRTTYKPPGVFYLYESYTDKHKQLGVRERSFHFIADWPGAVPSPSALVDVETRNFGNKHFEIRQETVPGLFSADEFCSERPSVTPPDFRALLGEHMHCFVDFGVAAPPPDPLPAGVIKWCDNQEDVYTHKVCITDLDLLGLPKTINNKETNSRKQFVAVDRTLELDTAVPLVPTALMDVEFTKLGDGTALEIHKTVPEVFDEHRHERTRPVVTPEDFRALLTEHEEDQVLEGATVLDPFPLPIGVIRHSRERQTEFTYKDSVRTIDTLSLPMENDNSVTNKFKQVETVKRILELATTIPFLPTSTRDVEFTRLGDGTALEIRREVPIRFDEHKWTRERPVVTPTDFRALLTEKEESSVFAGIAGDPGVPPVGVIRHDEEQIDVFNMRDILRTIDILSLPAFRHNKETNQYKQVVNVTRTLELDTSTPALPTATKDVDFTQLGDGTALQIEKDSGTVFGKARFLRERPVVTPQDFRALLTEKETSLVSTAIAVDPGVPPVGVLRHEEEQVDVFNMRDTLRTIDLLTLPAVNANKETNQFKQVVNVTRTLELDTTLPAVPTPTKDVDFTKLGDGTALQVEKDSLFVFDRHKWTRERPVVTPSDFRALLTELEETSVFTGIASDPGPPPVGVLRHDEEQVDVFNMRDTLRTIDILSIPATRHNKETNQFRQVVDVTRTLELDTATPAVPTATKEVEFTQLGDGTALQIEKDSGTVFNRNRFVRERPIVTPSDFRALLTEKEISSVFSGIAVDPGVPPAGTLRHEEEQLDVFNMRDTIRTIDTLSLPATRANKETNQFKQIVDVLRTLELDTATPAVPTATKDVEFTKLGDGTALQIEKESHTVFARNKFIRERPIVTPSDFRALLTEKEISSISTGIAVDPGVPPAGTLRHEEEQVDVFNMRDTLRTIDTLSLPATNVNKETNRFKQVVTVTRILELDTAIPLVPTDVMDVEFTKLGDGTALEVRKVVPIVFDEKAASTELADLVPELFRAVIPITTEEFVTSAATIVDPPILATGDLFREEKRETAFTIRVRTRGRAGLTYPQTKTASRELGGERFGTEILKTVATLDTFAHVPTPLPDTGLGVTTSQVKDLGNGTWLKMTQSWDTATFWPILNDIKFDRETQTLSTVERQTVASTYTPASAAFTVEDVVAIDKYHSRRTKTTKNVSSINSKATALISYRYHPFKFPGTLDYTRLITYDHREGYRRASALLAKHKVRTWWKNSVTPPTLGPTGSGADVEVDEIITDTVNVPIFAPNNSTEAQTYPDVLHDDITNTLGAFYPHTSPSFTEYYQGTSSGSSGSYFVAIAVFPYGTGYHVGQTVSAGGHPFTVSNIGPAGELFGVLPTSTPSGNFIVTGAVDLGVFAVSGGGNLDVIQINYDVSTPGTAWVGSERTIAATVGPTDIPNLWKIVTESVVMR